MEIFDSEKWNGAVLCWDVQPLQKKKRDIYYRVRIPRDMQKDLNEKKQNLKKFCIFFQ